MERVNWNNQSVPPKIIALAGKFLFSWWHLLVDKNVSFNDLIYLIQSFMTNDT